MQAFLGLLLLCAPAARAQDAAAKELARVQAADQRLRVRAVEHSRAARARARAIEIAEAARRNAQSMPDSSEKRNEAAERAAERARSVLKEARERADGTRKDFLGSAKGYLKAEDAYHRATGEYYNEWEYDHVSAILNRPPRKGEELPDFSGDPPLIGPPDTVPPGQGAPPPPTDVPPDPGGDGGPADVPPSLDVVLADALAMNFRPSGPAASRRSAPTGAPAESDGPDPGGRGGSTDGAPALELDRGILLSQPSGGAAFSSPRRTAASSEDAPRAILAQAEYALGRNPRDAKAWAAKATALNALRRFDEAEKAAEQAVRLDPGNPKGYRALAWAQLHNGKPDAALANATRMIFLDPDNADGYLLRAFAYEMKGDRAKMLADLERAAARNPKYKNHLARARAGLRLFDPDSPSSDGLFEALPPLPPRRSNALTWVGGLLVALAGLVVAAVYVRTALARSKPVALAMRAPGAADSDLLAGKYRLGRAQGRGGTDPVWEAFDTTLERVVALKEVSSQAPERRELSLQRARAAAAVRHPNIAEIYEVLDCPPRLHLVFEWVPGKTVARLLGEKKSLTLAEAKALLAPVCEALAAAHGLGVVHGGVKAANVMVTAEGRVKLLDLGVARDGAATPAADVDALAACLREMAAGPAADALAAEHPADALGFKAALLAL